MLSRSGLSLRRLVPKRRNTSDDEDEFGFDNYDDASSLKTASKRQQRGGFWTSGKQTTTKKTKKNIPKPIVVIRRPDSVHRISSPLPSLPDTAQSSASSLCSCDCHHSHNTPSLLSGKRSPGLCSVAQSKRSYESSLPPTPRLGERVQQTLVNAPHKRRNIMHIRSASPEPTLDLLEALAIPPETQDEEPPEGRETPRPFTREQRAPLVEFSDNVQQLIRETDEAFKAVGSALAEARLAANTPTQHEQAGRTQSPPSRPTTPSRTVLRKPPQIITSPHKSPTRTSSVSKTTRKKAKRQRSKPRITTKPNSSRWTLTDNVSEMFNGRLFNRIEADEMLTPIQLHQMRQNRMAQLKPKKSTETIRTVVTAETDGSETPINPFHLEDLPSRIGNSGVRLTVPSPMAEKPPPRVFDFEQVVRRDFSSPALRKDKPQPQRKDQSTEESDDLMTINDISFPSPPVKNPMRFVPRRQLPPLPTIPEVTVTAPDSKGTTGSHRHKNPFAIPPASDEHVFLKSTPFTLTMPTYRHGPIRLAKDNGAKEPRARADETTLDWTAFQMAILGGAGDFFSGTTDYIRRQWWREDDDDDEDDDFFDEAADLADWFDSLGFEHGGLLVPAAMPPPLSTPSLSSVTTAATADEHSPVSPTASSLLSAQNLPIPVDSEFPSGFWNEAGDQRGATSPSTVRSRRNKFAAGGELGLRRWTGEGHPKRYVSRASVDSLPQSPMLDLVMSEEGVSETRDSGGGFTVPMGYNLGHDLGDFLKWEAEYVSAGGLYGSE